jgi:glyoxylase-like metal-dependent hydrolase (beta-lactamase superfamily II)
MLDPEKLLASAARIYGDRMQALWGEFLPVPENQLYTPEDGVEISIGVHRFLPINTPGHAEHHYAYLFEDLCFSGDVGGVRIPDYRYLRVPMPPPELHLGKWHESLSRLRKEDFTRLAPTHFGIFDDPEWHINQLEQELWAVEQWLEQVMPADPPVEQLRRQFAEWVEARCRQAGLSPDALRAFELANPLGMSADGLQRYWRKVRLAG